jgi:aminoglycoside 6-adenylyltransferase
MMKPEERSSDPLAARISEWARNRRDVCAAVLIGSRASPQGARDAFSDYDVILFLDPSSRLPEHDDWLRTFGTPVIVFHETTEHHAETVPTRLVQFRERQRIDFTLSRMELLQRIVEHDSLPDWLEAGYAVLADRDGLAERLAPPTGMAWVPRSPSEAEYRAVVEEFWWEALYVAKYVGRNELLPARYSLETVLRFRCLVPMLEWYVQLGRDWEQSIGVHGSGLRWLLDPDERTILDRTYAGEKLKQHAEALDAMIELFTRAARAVARKQGFRYPLMVERDTRALLKRE